MPWFAAVPAFFTGGAAAAGAAAAGGAAAGTAAAAATIGAEGVGATVAAGAAAATSSTIGATIAEAASIASGASALYTMAQKPSFNTPPMIGTPQGAIDQAAQDKQQAELKRRATGGLESTVGTPGGQSGAVLNPATVSQHTLLGG